MKSSGLCVICGASVPFRMIQFEHVTTWTFLFFIPKNFQYKVCYRICSVCLCFGWIAVFYYQCSHPVGFRRHPYGFGLRPPRGWFVSADTGHFVLMCHTFGYRFLPAFLRHHHRPHLLFPIHCLPVLDDLECAVQDVAQYLIPSAVLSVQPSQAVSVLRCNFGIS